MSLWKRLVSWIRTLSLDPVGAMGVVLATLGGGLFTVLFVASLIGVRFGPYAGILVYLFLPGVLLIGLVLIPIGQWRLVRRYRGQAMPRLDLDNPEHLRRLGLFVVLSAINVTIFGVAAYEGYHVSESNAFCGQVCHTVMHPEWTAYQASPHSRVRCVECHIGAGADWFVRSKLSGVRQVLAVAMDSYHRPIPTPLHDLRPARETCEECHWPEKFHGDRLRVIRRFEEDAENTELVTVLLLKIGGGSRNGRPVRGIHWHVHPANRVEYLASDASRQEIPWVRLETARGKVVEYVTRDYEGVEALVAREASRTMDCVDCHNRPTHTLELPEEAVDRALAEGILDSSIPYLKREAVHALRAELSDGDGLAQGIESILAERYASVATNGTLSAARRKQIADVLASIRSRNVFPTMRIDWGTYPNFLGHRDDGGCFRCHDGDHVSADGRTISDDCDTCHILLAEEEEDPEILEQLYEE